MGSSLGRGRARPGRCAVPAIAALASFGLAGAALAQQGGYVSAPKAWELDLQESATVGMDRLTALHDGLLIVISIICLFVLGLLVYVMWRFHESRNPTPSLTTHNTVLGQKVGVSKEKFNALPDYGKSPLFSGVERLVIRYAEEMTRKVQVEASLVMALREALGVEAVTQLTLTIAAANFTNRFNEALGTELER